MHTSSAKHKTCPCVHKATADTRNRSSDCARSMKIVMFFLSGIQTSVYTLAGGEDPAAAQGQVRPTHSHTHTHTHTHIVPFYILHCIQRCTHTLTLGNDHTHTHTHTPPHSTILHPGLDTQMYTYTDIGK